MIAAINNKYLRLLEDVRNIALKSGRNPQEIALIAVSKGHTWDKVNLAYEAGCRFFGESRLQEFFTKKSHAPADVRWHLIGSLQTKKVSKAIGQFELIHSVDSLKLAEALSKASQHMGVTTRILLQVNVLGEATKHGLSQEEWLSVFEPVLQLPNLQVNGLMTMAPLAANEMVCRNCFANLREFRECLQNQFGKELPHLSMGMSRDYAEAIKEGATLLRIGTALFEV